MDKVRQTDTGADQQSQPGAAVSTAEQDRGQPQALQTGRGEQQPRLEEEFVFFEFCSEYLLQKKMPPGESRRSRLCKGMIFFK